MPEQLIFKPEALQLYWFSVQPASWMRCGSESLTAESKGTRTSRTAPGGSDWRLRDSYMWWVENNSLLGTLIKQFCSDRSGGYRPTLQTEKVGWIERCKLKTTQFTSSTKQHMSVKTLQRSFFTVQVFGDKTAETVDAFRGSSKSR